MDPGREPSVGERIAYYLAPPPTPNTPLIGCVKAAEEAYLSCDWQTSLTPMQPPLHLSFYLDHQLLPPLRRIGDHLGWRMDLWLADLPRCVVRFRQKLEIGTSTPIPRGRGRGHRRRWNGQHGAVSIMKDFLCLRRSCLTCGSGDVDMNKNELCCAACLAVDPMASTRALVRNGNQVNGVL